MHNFVNTLLWRYMYTLMHCCDTSLQTTQSCVVLALYCAAVGPWVPCLGSHESRYQYRGSHGTSPTVNTGEGGRR